MSAFPASWREDFLAALGFLTRLPVGRAAAEPMPSLAASAWAFPLVGLAVGLIGGLLYAISLALGLPAIAGALIAVGATALATGGLHEDGLADCADGFGGGVTRDDKLAIMRDSRIGVYGVLALLFSVALRVVAISAIGGGWRVLGALIAAHTLARGFLPAAMRVLAPARETGLGAEAGKPEPGAVWSAAGIAVVIALIAIGIRPGLSAIIASVAAMAAMGFVAQRQIGGQTGDVLGAIEQCGEAAALLAAAAWAA
jgi:adenosylcobinamide-GDP ribazoletransferase